MISILDQTRPEDCFSVWVGHFDAQIDGWKHDNGDWRKATPQLIEWIKRQLQQFDYTIYFLVKDKDSGNEVEPYTFEIFDIAFHSFRLKPKDGVISFRTL